MAALFVLLGIFFDFFDGFAARLLKVQSALGVQLDSLADMVTSGVVPGIVMYQLILKSINQNSFAVSAVETTGDLQALGADFQFIQLLPFFGFIITLAAAYRLANFNIDERQSSSFIGLPTPAMALFVISLPLVLLYTAVGFATNLIENTYFLIFVTIVLSSVMNMEIPLFSLKFKNFSVKNNWIELLFLTLSVILLILLQFVAIPLIILLYVVFSIVKNTLN
tara:strand:- start:453441 stop:454109 length:669 start_codon:yes stop_codon:yes gene_type:complete